jgi:hypothetical protein
MRRQYALAILFLPLIAAAQDWALFPQGMALYYADSAALPVTADLYLMDSVRTEGDQELQFFNMQAWREALGTCASTLSDPNGNLDLLDYFLHWPKDSLIVRNDTVFQYSEYGSLPFFFLPQAFVGQQWTVTSDYPGNDYGAITITCTGLEQRTFLGITDSVKVFSLTPNGSSQGQLPVDAFQMVLSKSYGLVEFVPFNLFLYHPPTMDFTSLEVIGIRQGSDTLGFRKPDFSDFFHLHAGDVMVWEFEHYPGDISQPWYHFYVRDTITSSVITPDSVQYGIDRFRIDLGLGPDTSYSLVQRGYRTEYGSILGIGPNSLTPAHGTGAFQDPYFTSGGIENWLYATSTFRLRLDPGSQDTITALSYSLSNLLIVTENCEVNEVIDEGFAAALDTRAGFTLVDWSDVIMNVHRWTLIGSVIDGVPDGNYTVGLAEPRIEPSMILVRPNPAHDHIFLQLASGGNALTYEFRDAMGRFRKSGVYSAKGIPVSELPAGLYVVRASLGDRTAVARFVKQ